MKHTTLFMPAFVLLVSTASYSQQTTLSSGGDAIGSNGSMSSSIGQVVYTSHAGSNGTSTQGVQQTYTVSDASIISPSAVHLQLSVFPNPTSDLLQIKVTDFNNEALSYRLINPVGQEIEHGIIDPETTQINLQQLGASYYMLYILEEGVITQLFKVLKTN